MRRGLVQVMALVLLVGCDDDDASPGADASALDASPTDARPNDSQPADAMPTDALRPDAQVGDSQVSDAQVQDARVSVDGAATDAWLDPPDVQWLDGSTCQPECPSGASRCDEAGRRQTCETGADGCSVWSQPTACPEGEACSEGRCATRCTDADTRCVDGEFRQVCTNGSLTRERCTFGCQAAVARCAPCPAGAWRCTVRPGGSATLEACPFGEVWEGRALCESCECTAQGGEIVMACGPRQTVDTSCQQCSQDGLFCFP